MKRFLDYVFESKSSIINALEKEFDHQLLIDGSQNFTPTQNIMDKVFDILNATIFNKQLPKISVLCITEDEIQKIFDKYGNTRDPSWYYALYFPVPKFEYIDNQHKNQKPELMYAHYLILNTSNEKMSFAFAISALCHEMIHYYDSIKGDLLFLTKEGFNRCVEVSGHNTEIFTRKCKIANEAGLTIIPDDGGYTAEDLARISAYRIRKLDEAELNIDQLWTKTKDHVSYVTNKHGKLVGLVI